MTKHLPIMNNNETFYILGKSCLVTKLGPTLCHPLDCTHQASLSMGFPRQEYWSGLPFPSPGFYVNILLQNLTLGSMKLIYQVDI